MLERIEQMCGKADADVIRNLIARVETLEAAANPHVVTKADDPTPVQLTPVGIDTDGEVKPIEGLSYTPPDSKDSKE